MIVYFTGTGNSRYCAKALAERLGDELMDSFRFIRDGAAAELYSDKPWIFVAPTYSWQMPRLFEDFIRHGSFSGSREAYFLLTCGGHIGDAGARLEALCREKGFSYRGVMPVVMPNNYIVLSQAPSMEKARQIIRRAHPTLDKAARLYPGRPCAFPPAHRGPGPAEIRTGERRVLPLFPARQTLLRYRRLHRLRPVPGRVRGAEYKPAGRPPRLGRPVRPMHGLHQSLPRPRPWNMAGLPGAGSGTAVPITPSDRPGPPARRPFRN